MCRFLLSRMAQPRDKTRFLPPLFYSSTPKLLIKHTNPATRIYTMQNSTIVRILGRHSPFILPDCRQSNNTAHQINPCGKNVIKINQKRSFSLRAGYAVIYCRSIYRAGGFYFPQLISIISLISVV